METGHDQRPITEGTEASPLRTIKDSVFRDLFENTEYLLQLYQCIHPEDTTATEADISNVTIRNILVEDLYNDLGFTVRDRQLILLEAQSTWSANIVLRVLLYLADTWNAHIREREYNLYGTNPIPLPSPEFYVLYTGNRKERPEWLSFSDLYLDGDSTYIDVKVKMLYGDGSVNGILNQYVTFSKVIDEQIKQHGRTQKAVEEAIRICRDMGALEQYLKSREKEVLRIMTSLFSQEYATKAYVAEISAKVRADSLAEGKAEGRAEGRAEGKAEGKAEGIAAGTARAYYDMVHKNLLPISIAAAELNQSEEEFKANMERYFSK